MLCKFFTLNLYKSITEINVFDNLLLISFSLTNEKLLIDSLLQYF